MDGEPHLSHFKSLGALKKAVQTHLQQQFCNICLESRKVSALILSCNGFSIIVLSLLLEVTWAAETVELQVFIPEQILYSKSELSRHQRTGDVEGAMAESGFRGHPLCRCVYFLYTANSPWHILDEMLWSTQAMQLIEEEDQQQGHCQT